MKSKTNDVVKQLLELNKLIKSLDPSIRQQAFELLRPIFFGPLPVDDDTDSIDDKKELRKELLITKSKETFFRSFDHKKPSDNVFLIAAWLYSQHGVFSIPQVTIKTVAAEVGLTVPGRPDMTLKQAGSKGKRLFTAQGSGYKPTVHGEAFLKETYGVQKGNVPFTSDDEK